MKRFWIFLGAMMMSLQSINAEDTGRKVLLSVGDEGYAARFDNVPVQITGEKPAGFMLRDFAAESEFVAFPGGETDGKIISATLSSEGSRLDRSFTFYYTFPAGEGDWYFIQDLEHSVKADKPTDYWQVASAEAGRGMMSQVPFAAVYDPADGRGRAIGFDFDSPAFGRVGYNGATRELFIAFDLALTPEKPEAEVRLIQFDFDASVKPCRAAWQAYYDRFPDGFKVRAEKQGQWMAFAPISKIENWEDFQFAFKEGHDEAQWDLEHGIQTFRYTEPMTWWMPMPESQSWDYDGAVAQLQIEAEKGNPEALGILSSGMHDKDGKFSMLLQDTPWCRGAVWSANSMPGIQGETTNFSNRWNKEILRTWHSKESPIPLAGEYVDSSEGYVTIPFSYRRDHFAAADTPLTFAQADGRPGIFRGLVAYEYIRAIAKDIHQQNRLMMANATPWMLWYLAGQLDVMGTEANWFREGKWAPASLERLMYIRSICGAKPYCFLMNTDFTKMPAHELEKYFQRTGAFGMFPGFFSADASTNHYYSQPTLYNRDRWLFKKYMGPIRTIAEAGWQVVGRAESEEFHLESFGNGRYLTIFNDHAVAVEGTVKNVPPPQGKDLLTGEVYPCRRGNFTLTLQPGELRIVDFNFSEE